MFKVKVLDFDMWVRRHDEGISEELERTHIHEARATEIYLERLLPTDIVFDAGANLGYYVLIAAHKGCVVYAIEPDPENLTILNFNAYEFNKTHKNKIYTMELGLSNYTGTANFTRLKFSNSGNIPKEDTTERYKDWVKGWKKDEIEIKVRTLNSLVTYFKNKEFPSVLRMDVEGHELEIIEGGNKFLEKMPLGSKIFMEMHPLVVDVTTKYDSMVELIKSTGFKIDTSVVSEKEFYETMHDQEVSSFHAFFKK